MNKLYCKKIRTTWGIAVIIFNKKTVKQVILPGKNDKFTNNYTSIKSPPLWIKSIEQKIKNYFNGGKVEFNLNRIDLNDYTNFEEKVFKALFKVKYSKTISYKGLAGKAGSPKACRAVGNIMANNNFPLLLPCHRVIRSNGNVGQFGYGRDYKLRMLKLENIHYNKNAQKSYRKQT